MAAITSGASKTASAGLFAALATTASYTAANLVCSLLRNKGLAMTLAPAGFGEWSQIMSFFLLLQTAAILGVTTGVTRFVAEYQRNGQPVGKIFTTAITFVGGFAIVMCIGLVAAAPWVAEWIVDHRDWWWVVWVVALAVPLVSLQSIFQAGLQGFEDYRRLAKAAILGAFGGLGISLVGAYFMGAQGVAFFILGSFLLTSILYYRAVRQHVTFSLAGKIDWELTQRLMAYGGVAMLGTIMAGATSLAARSMMLHQYGATSNGYYQAMSGLTLQILPVFLSGIFLYVTPKLGGVRDTGTTVGVFQPVVRMILLLVLPLLSLGMVFREPFFQVLFSQEFTAAAAWFPVQLTGDLLLSLSWAAGAYLLPTGRLRTFLVCEMARAAVFMVAAATLLHLRIDSLGLGGLTIAHTASYFTEALFFLLIARSQLKMPLTPLLSLLTGTAVIWLLILAASYLLPLVWRVPVWGIAIAVYWVFFLEKHEWVSLYSLLRPRKLASETEG